MSFVRFIYGSRLGLGYIPSKSLKEGDEIVNPRDGSLHTVDRIYGAELIEDDSKLNGMPLPVFTDKNNPITLNGQSAIELTRAPSGFRTSIVPATSCEKGQATGLTPPCGGQVPRVLAMYQVEVVEASSSHILSARLPLLGVATMPQCYWTPGMFDEVARMGVGETYRHYATIGRPAEIKIERVC